MEEGLGDGFTQAVKFEVYAMNSSRYLSLELGSFCGLGAHLLSLVLKVWSTDQRHPHHRRVYRNASDRATSLELAL